MTKSPRRRSDQVPQPPAKFLARGEPRQPEPISDVLGSVFEKVTQVDRRAVELVEEWHEIAGRSWHEARPIGLRNGMLTVEVASGSSASVLRFEVADLQAALSARFGSDLVTGVRLRVARSSGREPL